MSTKTNKSSSLEPRLSIETKLLDNYLIAKPVQVGSTVSIAENAKKELEVFTIGSDKIVKNIHRDPLSDTGWSICPLPSVNEPWILQRISVGRMDEGSLIVFGVCEAIARRATETKLVYWIEDTSDGERSWQVPKDANPPFHFLKESAISIGNINDELHVATLVEEKIENKEFQKSATKKCNTGRYSPKKDYNISFTVNWPEEVYGNYAFLRRWSIDSPNSLSPINLDIEHSIKDLKTGWSTFMAANYPALVVCLDSSIQFFIKTREMQWNKEIFQNTDKKNIVLKDYAVLEKDTRNGIPRILAILDNGEVCRCAYKSWESRQFTWEPIQQGLEKKKKFTRISAVCNRDGDIEVFLVSTDNILYHVRENKKSSTGWTTFTPIAGDVSSVVAGMNGDGGVVAFTVGKTAPRLKRISEDAITGLWRGKLIEIEPERDVEKVMCYATEVIVRDENGLPRLNAPVKIWSNTYSEMAINGSNYWTDPKDPIECTTDDFGKLRIYQTTETIAAPKIFLWMKGMEKDMVFQIEPDATQVAKLKALTSEQLVNAKDETGNTLVSEVNIEPVHQAVSNVAGVAMLSRSPQAGDVKYLIGRNRYPGLSYISRKDIKFSDRICPEKIPDVHWSLNYSKNGTITFKSHSREEAAALIDDKTADLPELGWSISDIVSDIGDIASGVANSLVDIGHILVTGGTVVINLYIDGIEYIFNGAIEFVSQAMDLIEVIFESIKVAVQQVLEWLAELFGFWLNVFRTKDALVHSLDEVLLFAGDAAAGMRKQIDPEFDAIHDKIDGYFNVALDTFGEKQSIGDITRTFVQEDEKTEKAESATSNNVIAEALMQHGESASMAVTTSYQLSAETSVKINDLLNEILQVANDPDVTQHFQLALDELKAMIKEDPTNIATLSFNFLIRILQGTVTAALKGIQIVVDLILDAIKNLITAFRAILNQPIPVISDIYGFIYTLVYHKPPKEDLRAIDIIALLIAIPTTLLFRVFEDDYPFPDTKALADFKSQVTHENLLAISGLGTHGEISEIHMLGDSDYWLGNTAKRFFQWGGIAATAANGLLTISLDGWPTRKVAPKLEADNAPNPSEELERWSLITDWIICVCDLPVFIEKKKNLKKFSSVWLPWSIQFITVGTDQIFFISTGKLARFADNWGVGISIFLNMLGGSWDVGEQIKKKKYLLAVLYAVWALMPLGQVVLFEKLKTKPNWRKYLIIADGIDMGASITGRVGEIISD